MTMRRAVLAGVFALGTVVATLSAPVSAAPGDWSRITTPAGPTYRFHYVGGGANTFTVSGHASSSITSVDIYCYAANVGAVNPTAVVTNVPVTSGSFSGTAHFTNLYGPCRLRALPSGSPTTGYVASFAGPIVVSYGSSTEKDGGTLYGYQAASAGNDGVVIVSDAGQYGVYALLSVIPPADHLGPLSNIGNFALRSGNVTASGTPTQSSIRVDGHNAYLPFGVKDFLRGTQGLTLTQSSLTLSQAYAPNGDATLTESAPLMRCTGDNTYPPTSGSCPALEPTGVKLVRISHFFRDGHQVRVRDSFVSTDGAKHALKLQYLAAVEPQSSGAPGFIFPKHGSSFRLGRPNHTLTGFGAGAASVLERSDFYATADDPAADTSAVTWSRPPSSIIVAGSGGYLNGMNYTLPVPAHGRGYLGFAVSERLATADVKPLAKLAERDMMVAPKITAPSNGGTVHGKKTTVTGRLSLGANGLPTSVKVNGHVAKITVKSAKSAIFSATFNESFGKHQIKVVATDAGGNVRSAAIRVTNKP